MASRLMQKDLGEAADVFAYKDAKQNIDANPFAVQQMAHQYRMQEVASANASRERAARMKTETEVGKDLVATGGWKWDKDPNSPTFNQAIPRDEANILSVRQKDKGTSTDIVNLNEQSAKYTSKQVTDKVVPYMTSMLVSIRDLQKQGKLSSQDIKTIFRNTNLTPEKLNEQLKSDPYKLITSTLGTTKLKQITNGFQAIIKANYDKGVKGFDAVGQQMSNYNIGLNDYYDYTTDLQNWRNSTKDAVERHVKETVDKDLKNYVADMYDKKTGQLVSEAEFMKKHKDNNKIQVGAPWSKGNNSVGSNERGKMIKVAGKDIYVTANNIEDVIKLEGKTYVDNNVKTGAQLMEQSKKLGRYSDQSKTSKLDPNKKYIRVTSPNKFGWLEMPGLKEHYTEITPTNKEYFYKKLGKERLTGTYGQLPEVDLSKSTTSIYNQLKKEIHKAYGSTNVKFETAPPMLSSIGQFKDAGLTTIGEHGVDVYLDDTSSAGAFHFNSFKNDFNNIDFSSDVAVSFKGATASAPNRNKEGNVLLQEIFRETSEPGSKLRGFRIAAQPLAQNKAGKGAMIIYPDAEWLKKHTYTEKGEGDKKTRSAVTISQDQANLILRNGITLISDEKNWKNSLYEATQVTPFQAHVNYSKDPVVLDDPNDDSGMNSISFKKDDILGGYNYSYKYKSWNPEKNTYEQKEVSDQIYSGAELEDVRARAYAGWPSNTKTNNETFNSNK
jgi:hypothetical protein